MYYKDDPRYQEALAFASKAHEGVCRKGCDIPYITHPIEVADIVAEMTDDMDLIVAALLHDVAEDTDYTLEDIRELFGQEVYELVAYETENKRRDRPAAETWVIRKQETIDKIRNPEGSEEFARQARMLALADKLANIRALDRDYKGLGDELWNRFNQKDKSKHAWYYRSVADAASSLKDYEAWQEYRALCDKVFGDQTVPIES